MREVVKCCLQQRTGDSVLREKLGKLASVVGTDWPPGLSDYLTKALLKKVQKNPWSMVKHFQPFR